MLNFFLIRLRPAPSLPETHDPYEIESKYAYWRLRLMYSMFIGYALYYFSRKSLAFAMPGLLHELQLDKSQFGMMSSVFALTYGASKFFSGVISDQSNPRYFMSLWLLLAGLTNILIGLSSSIFLFIILWALNGWFQGFGWPSCAKLLTHWYAKSNRGSWWSTLTVSQNVGAFFIPWIVSTCLYYFGWRAAMIAPGVICILGSFFLVNRLVDTPQSLGLPPIEKLEPNESNPNSLKQQAPHLSSRELVWSVLQNKYIWLLALAYCFVYFVRIAMSEWIALFMVEFKGYNYISAGGVASLFEVGGFLGGLSVGWISDYLFRARRNPVNALFALALTGLIWGFWYAPTDCPVIDSCLIFAIGFATFGPQVLIGVTAAELTHKSAAGTATGFIGLIAYLGAASAGFPLGKIIDRVGWYGFLGSMTLCSFMACLLLAFLWKISNRQASKI